MPEAGGANIEIAHHLNEAGEHHGPKSRWHELLEVVEAIVLALVAICHRLERLPGGEVGRHAG